MRASRIRLHYAAILFILLPASAGIVAVRASATCEKFVRTYVTKPVRNTVSKTTADAWAAWRLAHPNWKPNPDAHRPKYVMTREEQVNKVELACEVPIEPTETTLFFETANVEPPPAFMVPGMSTQTAFPIVPTQIAQVVTPVPVAEAFNAPPPIPVPEVSISTPGPTPEPGGLMLMGTGLAGILLAGMRRVRAAKV